ncbi:hypothetical protein KLN70_18335 [Clostridioides difficile]|nr:hypothetical protein [Clostridioides difficile]MDO0307526.1 hypothetical protein [Clostridioides difficile]
MAIVYEFNYTGAEQSVVLPPGKYKFECFGACGGNYYDFVQCAKGGYTAGSLILKENTTLHVYVGQSGYCKGVNGIETCRSGFNGAGGITTYKSTSDGYYSLAGGGATDIRLIGGNWDNLQSLLSRIIVAGGGGGGSGYILTKDSYKPANYSPSSKYYFSDINSVVGGNTTKQDGYAKITLLQALPFLTISSYNSTTATFKADHTDPTLLTKIEYFIDDVLKETITTDLTTEKIINYTLEDNALHTLKIVVTDSANATAEKVVSISKGIAPLPAGSTTDEVTSKWIEIKDTFKSGKTSIINTLALKNIEASLNNTLVELSEKIKTSFDSSDASVQDLMNQLTQANNTITQLNTKYKVASGTVTPFKGDDTKIAYPYLTDRVFKPSAWVKISNLDFKPNIFFADFDYYDTEYKNNYKLFLFACCGVATQRGVDFSSVTSFVRKSSDEYFHANGWLYNNSEGDVYFNNTGVQIPAYSFDSTQRHIYKWYAIKFI